jgi:hypothetical protein
LQNPPYTFKKADVEDIAKAYLGIKEYNILVEGFTNKNYTPLCCGEEYLRQELIDIIFRGLKLSNGLYFEIKIKSLRYPVIENLVKCKCNSEMASLDIS